MKPSRIAIAFVASVIGLSATFLGVQPQNPAGMVQGTVLRAGTSEPVPNVQVTLATDQVDPAAFQALRVVSLNGSLFAGVPSTAGGDLGIMQGLTDSALSQGVSPLNGELATALNNYREQTAKFKTMTDSRGQFTIPDVPAGPYTIRAARDGYYGETASAISVPAGQQATASFSVLPGATIAGRIRGTDGEFIAGASVAALSVRYQNGFPVLAPALLTKTNSKGEYRLFWLMPGEYVVAATEEPVTGLEFPIPTYHPDTLDVTRSTPTVVKSGDNLEGVDVVVRPATKVHVSGRVSLPATAAATFGATRYQPFVTLTPRNRDIPNLGAIQTTASTVRDGLTFDAMVPPGAYDVAVSVMAIPATPTPNQPGQPPVAPGPISATSFYYGYGSVDVVDRDVVVNVGTTTEAKANVKLTVDGVAPPVGTGPTALRLYLNSEAGGIVLGNRQALVGADGVVVATAQPGVRLRLTLFGLAPDVYIAELRKDGVNVLETGLSLSADTSSTLEILASSGGGVAKGVVRNAAGAPLRSATVVLVPSDARRQQNKLLFRTAKSDPKGQFTVTGIAPGDYKLFAWENVAGDGFMNPRYLSRYESAGIAITVAKGATITKDLAAIPAGQ